MELTKIVPARRKTVKFLWCKKNYSTMGEGWREARKNMGKKLENCFWCNHKFDDGEKMHIACPEKATNKLLCGKCADELIDSDKD